MIRRASLADVDHIMEMERSGFDRPWSREAWVAELVADDRDVLCWDTLGAITVQTVGDLADLLRVVVHPHARRRGIARLLVEEGIRLAAARGARRMLLEVATDNDAARALYDSCSFRDIARRADYYGPGRDAIVMSRELEET